MPFGVRLEDAAPLQIFFTQAGEGVGKEDALAFSTRLWAIS
jgi:hypothetical protein